MTNEEENKNHHMENLDNQEIDGQKIMGGGVPVDPNMTGADATVTNLSDPTAAVMANSMMGPDQDAIIIDLGNPTSGSWNGGDLGMPGVDPIEIR